MVTAQWHPTLSTQRQPSVGLSAQRQIISSHTHSKAQKSGQLLHQVCDVPYCRPLGWGLLLGAAEGHPPHWDGHSVYAGYPHQLIFYNATGTHGCYCRPSQYCHTQCLWVRNPFWWLIPLQTCIHPSKTRWQCCSWGHLQLFDRQGGSDWIVNTLGFSVWGIRTSPSPILQLWGICLRPLDKGGICLVVTMGLEGCSTFSQPGNLLGGLFSAVGSMAISMVASFMGALAGVGWALWGVTSSGEMAEDSSGGATPLNMSSSEKER